MDDNMHILKKTMEVRNQKMPVGFYSACTANKYVIEAIMEAALVNNEYILVEATANQVNQFGGYTGMQPMDFRNFLYEIADKVKFPTEKLIIGGDHLGPLTWQNDPYEIAIKKAADLIEAYVMAGFTKIHIDTSMRLADDDHTKPLDTAVIASRGAFLCSVAEKAYESLKLTDPTAIAPVYVIGSEVPIPGGGQDESGSIQVTKPEDFENTVNTFREEFLKYGLHRAWDNVIAVVAQPGVEFSDNTIHSYDRAAASKLCSSLTKFPGIVLEGHSTDYQTRKALKEMVEDGISILKVGPALTFALREALFALNYIERELFADDPSVQLSNFIDVLDDTMVMNPEHWDKYYHGSESHINFARKYSFSDRCRYYLNLKEIDESIERLIYNLKDVSIPLPLISQFMPTQYTKIREGILRNTPESLMKDRVIQCVDDYRYATSIHQLSF